MTADFFMQVFRASWRFGKWCLLAIIVLLAIAWVLTAAGNVEATIALDGLVPLRDYSALALLALLAMALLFAFLLLIVACWMGCKRLVKRLSA